MVIAPVMCACSHIRLGQHRVAGNFAAKSDSRCSSPVWKAIEHEIHVKSWPLSTSTASDVDIAAAMVARGVGEEGQVLRRV